MPMSPSFHFILFRIQRHAKSFKEILELADIRYVKSSFQISDQGNKKIMSLTSTKQKIIIGINFGLCLLLLNLCLTNMAVGASKQELVYLSWSEYIDPELIKNFEKEFNCIVREFYYETDEMKDEFLIERDGSGYDVVLSSGMSILAYIKRNWVAPLNPQDIPNLKYIDPKWNNREPRLIGYAVPYLWGTIGIAYRRDLIPAEINSWRQLFQPAEYLKNRIVMLKDSRETVGLALKSLGHPINSTNIRHYNEAEQLLLAQKPFVKTYSYISFSEDSFMVTGEAWMVMIYNGDALWLQERHPQISYSVPQEGTLLWMDYLVVMQNSKNKKLAFEFINYIQQPQNSARNSESLYFANPNKAAEKLLPKEILENPAIYPDPSVLDRSEFVRELPAKIVKKRNEVFARVIQ
ncbi:MAG: spermidine/putrescine ABC transporter substrate-binding protein [Desulfobacterales bacterium]|nr:MAG: spermidine/putrescine ABC transporter substrate-binding protein [Desulfobacterales bacterium]